MAESTDNHRPRILVVDDDRFFLRQMVDILIDGGFKAQGVTSGEQALELLEDNKFKVIVTDIVMGEMSGIELLQKVRMHDRLTPVICVSGVRSFDNVVEMIRTGASDFLPKPFNPAQLLSAVRSAVIDHEISMEKKRRSLPVPTSGPRNFSPSGCSGRPRAKKYSRACSKEPSRRSRIRLRWKQPPSW